MILRRVAAIPVLLLLSLPLAATAPAFAGDACAGLLAAIGEPQEPVSPCPGIGPGSALVLRVGPYDPWMPLQLEEAYCSMSFIVTDGTDLYVSTAGHCVEDSLGVPTVGQRVSAHGVPGEFGTVAYQWCEGQAANGGCGAGTDFGLIRIDADKLDHVHPEMCAWGAPTGGIVTTRPSEGYVQHFGWGLVLGSLSHVGVNKDDAHVVVGNPATQARQGIVMPSALADATFGSLRNRAVIVETAAISGDSGSGVMYTPTPLVTGLAEPEPQALGVLTHISVGGIGVVQRLDVSLARAGSEMGKTFTLVTSL